MIFRIKCSTDQHVLDIWNIFHSHIINSPDDANKQDCILYLTSYHNELKPIYEINYGDFMDNFVNNRIIEFNNSTSIIVLEFVSDGIGSFKAIENDIFQLDY